MSEGAGLLIFLLIVWGIRRRCPVQREVPPLYGDPVSLVLLVVWGWLFFTLLGHVWNELFY